MVGQAHGCRGSSGGRQDIVEAGRRGVCRTSWRLQDLAETGVAICWEGTRPTGGGTWERPGQGSHKDPRGNLGATTG